VVVDAVMDYIRTYNQTDPHKDHVASSPVGSVLHTETEFPRHAMATHPFYRDFWDPYGVRSLVATKVAESERHMMIVSVVRSFQHASFSPAEVAQAGRYFTHLSAAFQIAKRLHKTHIVANVGLQLMEASDRPMFLLGLGAAIIGMNAAARRILESREYFVEQSGRLFGATARGAKILQAAVDSQWSSGMQGAGRSPNERVALRMFGADDGQTALCVLWDVVPAASMSAFGPHRTLLLSVTVPQRESPLDPVFVAALLNLTAAEARVATLLVSRQTAAEIAATLHVTLATVRTHLRSLFDKTDTKRQVDLVHLITQACAP
jgi:DNA-binding CsgD family transcriptional regulator